MRLGEREAVVHADGGRARVTHVVQELSGARAEVQERGAVGDAGPGEVGDMGEGRRRVRLHVLEVVVRRERTGPRVEQLRGGGAGLELGAQELAGHGGRPAGQGGPGLGVGVHHASRAEVVAGGTALHHVRRQREGGAGEADQGARAQLGDGGRDGLADDVQGGVLEDGQRGDVVGGADGLAEHGAHAGLDLHVHARQAQGDHDVREEDRRVDVVAAHRLHRDLPDQVRHEAGVEHPDPLAHPAVLGQRTAGLPHEPHGVAVGALAAQRTKERAGHGRA